MSKLKSITAVCSLFLFVTLYLNQASAKPVEFTKVNFEQIKQKNLGKKWVMILWSIDCPACFKELALIQKIREKNPEISVVIVNTDDNDEVTVERHKIINSYKLSSLPNFYFGDGLGDQSRYLIDKSWYGELPRSYFFEDNGKFHGKSGLVKEALVKKWLNVN